MQTATRTRPRRNETARVTNSRWRRGWFIAALAILTALTLAGHRYVPNSPGNLGSLLETFLPWVGAAVPPLALAALVRRSAVAGIALLVPTLVWVLMFGELVVPGKGGGPHNLRVLSHNVDAGNTDHAGTARELLAAKADVIALEELTPEAFDVYERAFGSEYQHQVKRSTISLWSRYPLTASTSVDIGMGWTRALRAEVRTPDATVAMYVAHLASVRIGTSGFTSDQRNETIESLGRRIADEERASVVLMGDLNGTASDRSLAPITSGLRSAQGAAGDGFGFTWPARFPMARIDHILIRGVTPARAWVLSPTGSDHRPVVADLRV